MEPGEDKWEELEEKKRMEEILKFYFNKILICTKRWWRIRDCQEIAIQSLNSDRASLLVSRCTCLTNAVKLYVLFNFFPLPHRGYCRKIGVSNVLMFSFCYDWTVFFFVLSHRWPKTIPDMWQTFVYHTLS